jgi:chemotaxis protein MotA
MGLACVAYILVDGQILNILMDKAALVFVLGGTFASTMMTYPFRIFRKIPTGYKLLLFPPKFIPVEAAVTRMCDLAEVAHLRGIDALPERLLATDLDFLRSGVRMLMNEWTEEDIIKHLEQDMQGTIDRHAEVQRMFESMGTYAPIYGLLGTLIGVLGLLRFLGDPKGMGNAMAKAITTFYGIFFANFFALPVAG